MRQDYRREYTENDGEAVEVTLGNNKYKNPRQHPDAPYPVARTRSNAVWRDTTNRYRRFRHPAPQHAQTSRRPRRNDVSSDESDDVKTKLGNTRGYNTVSLESSEDESELVEVPLGLFEWIKRRLNRSNQDDFLNIPRRNAVPSDARETVSAHQAGQVVFRKAYIPQEQFVDELNNSQAASNLVMDEICDEMETDRGYNQGEV